MGQWSWLLHSRLFDKLLSPTDRSLMARESVSQSPWGWGCDEVSRADVSLTHRHGAIRPDLGLDLSSLVRTSVVWLLTLVVLTPSLTGIAPRRTFTATTSPASSPPLLSSSLIDETWSQRRPIHLYTFPPSPRSTSPPMSMSMFHLTRLSLRSVLISALLLLGHIVLVTSASDRTCTPCFSCPTTSLSHPTTDHLIITDRRVAITPANQSSVYGPSVRYRPSDQSTLHLDLPHPPLDLLHPARERGCQPHSCGGLLPIHGSKECGRGGRGGRRRRVDVHPDGRGGVAGQRAAGQLGR